MTKYNYRSTLKSDQYRFESTLIKSKNKEDFYKYIKRIKNPNQSIMKILDTSGSIKKDSNEIADIFNNYFKSVYNPLSLTAKNTNTTHVNITMDESLIKTSIKAFSTKNSIGPDEIPGKFLYRLSHNIAPILVRLFNLFIKNKYIPELWKISYVIPIYKKAGDPLLTKNYRPIAIGCALFRIFEKALAILLQNKIDSSLSKNQHGFRKKHSVVSNTLASYYTLYSKLNNREPVDIITIDLAKAFDKVDLNILMDKLRIMGLEYEWIDLIELLLFNRKQQVRINNCLSEATVITSVVPQGSPISPILFAVYIDDLLQRELTTFISSYADDLKLSGAPGIGLQMDLATIKNWCESNIMTINENKCECIHFGTNNPETNYTIGIHQIPPVTTIRDLGILIDNKLTFNNHVDALRKKCFKLINFIFRLLSIKQADPYLHLYKLCVLPTVRFGSHMYGSGSSSALKDLESIQKYFTRKLFTD